MSLCAAARTVSPESVCDDGMVIDPSQLKSVHVNPTLRTADVEVVALCGRTPAPARAMADKLGITDLRFDWRQAIEEVRPDIVAITTPAPPHREMVEFAAQRGCHIAYEKPLALTA